MVYWICFFLAKIIDKIYFSCTFIGKENLPLKESYIIASNHLSNLDPFILGSNSYRRFSYLAKEELFKTKLSAWIYHQLGAIPIKRDAADFHAIRETVRRLKKGIPVIVFPEGTRGVGGRQKKPQAGIALIAIKGKVPVVPAYIQGSDKALPNGAKWFKRHHVQIVFGKPLRYTKEKPYEEISSQILDEIYALAPLKQA